MSNTLKRIAKRVNAATPNHSALKAKAKKIYDQTLKADEDFNGLLSELYDMQNGAEPPSSALIKAVEEMEKAADGYVDAENALSRVIDAL